MKKAIILCQNKSQLTLQFNKLAGDAKETHKTNKGIIIKLKIKHLCS